MPSSGSFTAPLDRIGNRQRKSSDLSAKIAILALLWGVLHVVATLKVPASADIIDIRSTDSFMRLVRVGDLFANGGWYDVVVERDNAPFGYALHWTRPFDLLLLVIALPLAMIFEFQTALYWAGIVAAPLLHLVLVFAFIWAVIPLVSRESAFVAALVFLLSQPIVISYSLSGYADHHTLLFVCFVVTLGYTIRAARDSRAAAASLSAGLAAGIGVWLSTELLLGAAVCVVALGLTWLAEGRRRIGPNLRFALGFLAAVCIGLLIERGTGGLFDVEYDRISVAHAAVALLLAGFWAAAARLEGRMSGRDGWARRLAIGGLGGIAILGFAYVVFPGMFAGPLAAVDPRIEPIWHDLVQEMAPLWPDSLERLANATSFLGLAVVTLPFVVRLLGAGRQDGAWWGWLLLALGAAVFTAASLAHLRLAGYAEILYVMILALMIERIDLWRAGLARKNLGAAVYVLALGAAALGPAGLGFGFKKFAGIDTSIGIARAETDCSISALAPVLNDRSNWVGAGSRTILAMIDYGPELLYRTQHRVIGSPYHRNPAGILDTHEALASGDDDAIRAILDKRAVDIVLVCPSGPEETFFQGPAGDAALYRRLARGEIPPWLTPVRLADPLPGDFRLYRVVLNHQARQGT